MFAVGGRGPGSHHSGSTPRLLVEACGAQGPQHHRRSAARFDPTAAGPPNSSEACECEHGPLVAVRRDQSATSAREQLEILCGPVYSAPGLGETCQIVIDQSAPNAVG